MCVWVRPTSLRLPAAPWESAPRLPACARGLRLPREAGVGNQVLAAASPEGAAGLQDGTG